MRGHSRFYGGAITDELEGEEMPTTKKIPAGDVQVGNVFETPWNGNSYRVQETSLSPSGKIVRLATVVVSSPEPNMPAGRTMNFSHRVGTLVRVQLP